MTTTEGALYRLMTWLSPAYPVGGFSYSHGLEYAVEEGIVRDGASLTAWIGTVIGRGAGGIDAALCAAAWRAVTAGDDAALRETVDLAAAWRGTAETALESATQGAAFLSVTKAVWPVKLLERIGPAASLCVAVGAVTASHGIPLRQTLIAYLQAFAANLVSAGVRLVPLGQTDGQRAMAALEPVVQRAAEAAMEADPDELGTAAPVLDWCSMKHETQYTRLFRS